MATRRKTCRWCGQHESAVGRISRAGYCATHGEDAFRANNVKFANRDSAEYQEWLHATMIGQALALKRRFDQLADTQ